MNDQGLRTPGNQHTGQSPVVSVIIPTYNYSRYLREAVESVRAQSFHEWECLVIDDGSTDETDKVLSDLVLEEPRVVAIAQPNLGLSGARNTGLRRARGRFIQFLDADDLLSPGKLAAHVHALETMPEVDIVYGPVRYFDDTPPGPLRMTPRDPERPEPPAISGRGAEVLRRLLTTNQMTVVAPLVRRSVFDAVGTFDEGLSRMEDWDLWLRCAIAGKSFGYVWTSQPVALVRTHTASLSHGETRMRLAEIQVRLRLRRTLDTPESEALNSRLLSEARAHAGWAIGLDGDPKAGLRQLVRATVRRPNVKWARWTAGLILLLLPGGRRLFDLARPHSKLDDMANGHVN